MAMATVPEQLIATLLKTGVTAISANIALLDPILAAMTTNDKAAVKDYWTSNPPNILSGYARAEGPFPVVSIVLQAEQTIQDYIGFGQEYEQAALLDGTDDYNVFKRRLSGTYALHVMAEHPDVCLAYYRVVRRILSVGSQWMIDRDLYDPQLVGQDLGPDTKYTPEHLFIRKIMLTVEYEEDWRDTDPLAQALGLADWEPKVVIPHGPADDPSDPNFPGKNFGPIVHEDGGNGPADDDPSVYPGWHPISPDDI